MSSRHVKRSFTNLLIDFALVLGFAVPFGPSLTGLDMHEWLGLAFGAGLVVHLVRHWRWVVGVTQKLLGKLPLRTRVYYVLDAGLLLSFLIIIGSGVVMSGAVLPALGLSGSTSLSWVVVHKLASTLTLALLAVKLVLHRTWLADVVRRLLARKGALAEQRGLACERVAVSSRKGR